MGVLRVFLGVLRAFLGGARFFSDDLGGDLGDDLKSFRVICQFFLNIESFLRVTYGVTWGVTWGITYGPTFSTAILDKGIKVQNTSSPSINSGSFPE